MSDTSYVFNGGLQTYGKEDVGNIHSNEDGDTNVGKL